MHRRERPSSRRRHAPRERQPRRRPPSRRVAVHGTLLRAAGVPEVEDDRGIAARRRAASRTAPTGRACRRSGARARPRLARPERCASSRVPSAARRCRSPPAGVQPSAARPAPSRQRQQRQSNDEGEQPAHSLTETIAAAGPPSRLRGAGRDVREAERRGRAARLHEPALARSPRSIAASHIASATSSGCRSGNPASAKRARWSCWSSIGVSAIPGQIALIRIGASCGATERTKPTTACFVSE